MPRFVYVSESSQFEHSLTIFAGVSYIQSYVLPTDTQTRRLADSIPARVYMSFQPRVPQLTLGALAHTQAFDQLREPALITQHCLLWDKSFVTLEIGLGFLPVTVVRIFYHLLRQLRASFAEKELRCCFHYRSSSAGLAWW